MFLFHKNQKKKPSGEEIYSLFKPFCDTKIGLVSTCKDVFGMRCLYHDQDCGISHPYLDDGTFSVKRNTIGHEKQHRFSKYDTDEDGDNIAYAINQKSSVCNLCVKRIREWMAEDEGKDLFVKKMKHVLQETKKTGEVDYATYSTPPSIFTACISSDSEEELKGLMEEVDKFLFNGNFEFGDESVLPTPTPINFFSYRAKTYKCETCQELLDSCECRCQFELSAFCYKNDENFEEQARIFKTSQMMCDVYKNTLKRRRCPKKKIANYSQLSEGKVNQKRRCLNIKSENDWKKDTLWYLGMATYCEFFSIIPATKPSRQDKKMDCDNVCKKLLAITDQIDEPNFVDVKNLLLAYRIMNRDFERNCQERNCPNFTCDEKKDELNKWLTQNFYCEDDNMI